MKDNEIPETKKLFCFFVSMIYLIILIACFYVYFLGFYFFYLTFVYIWNIAVKTYKAMVKYGKKAAKCKVFKAWKMGPIKLGDFNLIQFNKKSVYYIFAIVCFIISIPIAFVVALLIIIISFYTIFTPTSLFEYFVKHKMAFCIP